MLEILAASLALAGSNIPQMPALEVRGDLAVLRDDLGGDVNGYSYNFKRLVGKRVVVQGMCWSACTLVLANPKACAGPKAVFGFHKARYYNKTTGEILGESEVGNKLMWDSYPAHVKARLGELTPKFVYIKGTDLLPACE